MSLTGTLKDLNIVELIQFPNAGRKTGRLTVQDPAGHRCVLHYHDGQLIHASNGQLVGFETLVEILGWEQGEFNFESDQECAERNIETDLHRTVIEALKIRDERKHQEELRLKKEEEERLRLEEERRREAELLRQEERRLEEQRHAEQCRLKMRQRLQESQSLVDTPRQSPAHTNNEANLNEKLSAPPADLKLRINSQWNELLKSVCAEKDSSLFAVIVNPALELVAQSGEPGGRGIKQVLAYVVHFIHSYPRGGDHRLLLADGERVIGVNRFSGDYVLALIVNPERTFGEINLLLGRVASRLKAEFETANAGDL